MVVKSLSTAFVLLSCLACFVFACDIFLASKCPSPPTYQAVTFNYTAFCKETSDYVDCINKKLKNALKETKAMFKKGKIGILAPFLNMHPE